MQSVRNAGFVQQIFLRMFFLGTVLVFGVVSAQAQNIDRFVGTFSGALEIEEDGATIKRDVSVKIDKVGKGFVVQWSTATYKSDGRIKTKSYEVTFQPSERDGVYGAAMKTNVFGKSVPLDPMRGEPYVWGRIIGDTMTVFSLFVYEDGAYEIQQFDRTLKDGGLYLDFSSTRNGHVRRQASTLLTRD